MSYKRAKVLRALSSQGVAVLREGGKHTIIVTQRGKRTSLPRHEELDRTTTRKIVRQLELDLVRFEKDVR